LYFCLLASWFRWRMVNRLSAIFAEWRLVTEFALRPKSGTVMLTVRDTEDYKVQALEAGADHYITKRSDLREFIAGARAVLLRTGVTRSRIRACCVSDNWNWSSKIACSGRRGKKFTSRRKRLSCSRSSCSTRMSQLHVAGFSAPYGNPNTATNQTTPPDTDNGDDGL
jgi:hypothetical protein